MTRQLACAALAVAVESPMDWLVSSMPACVLTSTLRAFEAAAIRPPTAVARQH